VHFHPLHFAHRFIILVVPNGLLVGHRADVLLQLMLAGEGLVTGAATEKLNEIQVKMI